MSLPYSLQRVTPVRLRLSKIGLALVATGWCLALLIVWNQLLAHTYRPAQSTAAVAVWPFADQLGLTDRSVIVFAHPLCPCTRATLAELNESLEQAPPDLKVTIVFVTAGLNEDLINRSLTVQAAQQIKRAALHFDQTGELRSSFGASVSGEVFAFNSRGQREFHGGITAGRGHRGHSPSKDAFEKTIRGECPSPGEFPVFGCGLPQQVEEPAD